MKLKTLLFSLACFFPALAQASEVEFIYSGRIDSLYGYSVPAGRYKHNDHRDHWINLFSLNLGLEKEFNADYSAGLYADLNAGINKRQDNFNNGDWGQEIYGIIDSPYGRIMLGETYNTAYQFQVGAPRAGAIGLNDSDIVNFMANPNWVKTKHATAYRT